MTCKRLLIALAAGLLIYLSVRFLQTYIARHRLKRRYHCLSCPSIPEPVPLFGLTLLLSLFRLSSAPDRNQSIKSQLDAFGSTFSTWESPFRKRIFTIDPANLQAVFSSDWLSWGVEPLRRFVFAPLIGRGIMNSDGSEWEIHRNLLRPALSRTQLLGVDELEEHVSRMLAAIPAADSDRLFGPTVDMQPLLARQSLDVATELLFGKSTVTSTEEPFVDAKTFLDAYNYALCGVGKRMALPFWNVFTTDAKWWHSCKIARSLVERYVQIAQKERQQQQKQQVRCQPNSEGLSGLSKHTVPNGKHDHGRAILIDSLLSQNRPPSYVRDALLNIFMPAHDANAVLLTNIIFCLARRPAVFTQMRSEIISAFPDPSSISISMLSGFASALSSTLPLTNAVIRETLRLHPSIGTTSRIALNDTVLPRGGGPNGEAAMLVKKGDVLSTSFYALHRREIDWGKDADCWIPERWCRSSNDDDASDDSGHQQLQDRTIFNSVGGSTWRRRTPCQRWTYMPFGAGPRVCPGQSFAMAEVTYTLIRLVQTFDAIENRDPVEGFVERYKLSTESANGAKVAFRVSKT